MKRAKDVARMKKILPGATTKLFFDLLKREQQYLSAVVDIGEFRTSIVSIC
jgi:hypothetical protein